MDSEEAMQELMEYRRQRKEAEEQLKEARAGIDRIIVFLLKAGKEPKDVAELAGVSYEKVRTLARAHNIERLRKPTVTSRKKKR